MQKILRKRVVRDLSENLFRYLALGLSLLMRRVNKILPAEILKNRE